MRALNALILLFTEEQIHRVIRYSKPVVVRSMFLRFYYSSVAYHSLMIFQCVFEMSAVLAWGTAHPPARPNVPPGTRSNTYAGLFVIRYIVFRACMSAAAHVGSTDDCECPSSNYSTDPLITNTHCS